MNLGMNGALPTDLERIVDALLVSGVDIIIMDVTLRSLSSDFVSVDTVYSRKWLRSFALTAAGRLAAPDAGGRQWLDGAVRTWAINNSHAYRLRDLLRLYLLGEEPHEIVRRFRDGLGAWLRPVDDVDAETRLLLLARARYASVSFDANNPQILALTRLLDKLESARVPTLVFYATERPDIIEAITEPKLHQERLARLSSIITSGARPMVSYLGPLSTLSSGDFVDYVHVLPGGYEKYLDAIVARLDLIPNP